MNVRELHGRCPRLIWRALAFAIALVVSQGASLRADAQTVLVLDDSTGTTSAADAARRAGYGVDETRNVAGFLLALERDAFDVVVVDLDRLVFAPTLVDAVDAHIESGRPAIVAYAGLDDTPFAERLAEVRCNGDRESAALTISSAIGVGDGVDSVPSPFGIDAGLPADRCVPLDGDAAYLARFSDDASPAMVRTRGGLLWWMHVSGSTLESAGDGDGDGVSDAVELFRNALDDAVELRSAGVVGVGDTTFAEAWTAEAERTLTPASTPADLEALIREDTLIDAIVAELDASDPASVPWLALLREASAAGIPVVLSLSNLSGASLWTEPLEITSSVVEASGLVAAGPGLGSVLFGGGPVAFSEALQASALEGEGRLPVAAYASGESAAITWLDEPLVVVGAPLSAMGSADADEDGERDAFAWIRHAEAWLDQQAPLALSVSADHDGWVRAFDVQGLYVLEATPGDATSVLATHPLEVVGFGVGAEDASWEAAATAAADAARADELALVVSLVNPAWLGAGLEALGLQALDPVEGLSGELRPSPFDLSLLFERPQRTPRQVSLGVSEMHPLVPADPSAGAVVAELEGVPAIVTSANARIWTLAVSPLQFGLVDRDGDGLDDGDEVLEAMAFASLQPRETWIAAERPALFASAARAVGTRAVERDVTELPGAPIDALLVASLAGEDVVQDSASRDAILDVVASNRPLVLFANAISASSALNDALGVGATPADAVEALVEPFDGGSGIFRSPALVPSPIAVSDAGATPPGDVLEPLDGGEVAIRYRVNVGPVAALRSASGTRFVNGFDLSARSNADQDLDQRDDRAQLVANQLVAVGRAPVPRLEVAAEVEEGALVNVDASASFDPFGEALRFAWDLDGDGTYNDADGSLAVFDATEFDGPSVRRIGLEVTNESGLRAFAQREVLVTNIAPIAFVSSPAFVAQGSMLERTLHVIDVEADEVSAVWAFDDGVVLEGLSVMRAFDELGAYPARITVSDDDGGTTELAFVAQYTNVAPELDIVLRGDLLEGSPITFEASGEDPGGDAFTVSWAFGDGSTNTGENVMHSYADQGAFIVTASARDALDATSATTVSITIDNVPPTIVSEPPPIASAGFEYAYPVEAQDPGDDPLTITLLDGPPGMEVVDGVVVWTPGDGALSDVFVTLRVSDGDGGEDTQAFPLQVVFDDADGGGAADLCEERYAYDPDDGADDTSDDDGDGLTLAEECILGTDPRAYSGPGVPSIFAPRDGVGVNRAIITLQFDEVSDPEGDAITYEVELGDDEALTRVIFGEDDIVPLALGRARVDVDTTLSEDTTYFWRARAITEDVIGAWSETVSFRVNRDNRAPSVPALVDPTGVSATRIPMFRWRNATDVDGDSLTYRAELYAGDRAGETPLASVEGFPEAAMETVWAPLSAPLEEGATYYWRVRARDETPPFRFGEWADATFVVDENNGAPPTPVLQRPAAGEQLERDAQVELAWTDVEDPDGDDVTYRGELATDDAFDALIATFGAASVEEGLARWPVDVTLENGQTYYWRVAASDGRQESAFASSTFSLRGVNRPPSSPTLEFPTAGGRVTTDDRSITLVVTNAVDPDPDTELVYEFVLAVDVDISGQVARLTSVPEGEGVTQVRVEGIEPDFYFWRARAFDGEEFSSWSSVAGFELIAANAGGDTDGDAGSDGGGDVTPNDAGSDGDAGSGGGGGGCAQAGGGPSPFGLLLGLALLAFRRNRRGRG